MASSVRHRINNGGNKVTSQLVWQCSWACAKSSTNARTRYVTRLRQITCSVVNLLTDFHLYSGNTKGSRSASE